MAHVMLERTTEKKKRKLYDEEVIIIDDDEDSPCDTILYCKILHAEEIDQPRSRNSTAKRYYRVYASVNPEINEELDEVRSRFVRGDPNPCWNASFSISLGEFNPAGNIGKYLHLELVLNSEYGSEDPQPSNKEVVVGRTRIRLPNKISQTKSGSFELVKLERDEDGLDTKPAGLIVLSMVLRHEQW